MSKRDYEVGHGKPPKNRQFPKGRSGNPKGRPKGSRNINTILNQVIEEKIRVTENGKQRSITKLEAITRQLTSKALTGDLRAIKETLMLKQITDAVPDPIIEAKPDGEKNRAVLKLFAKRLRTMTTDATNPKENGDK